MVTFAQPGAAGLAAGADARTAATMQQACEQLATTDLGDIHAVSTEQFKLAIAYYQDVRLQARRSFNAALGAAGVGALFFALAAWTMLQSSAIGNISLIAGALVQVIAGINFYLYAHTSRQFAEFHRCMERMTRYLLAYNMTIRMSDAVREATQHDLICAMTHAPLIGAERQAPVQVDPG